ncbi:hypothetical protein [Sphingobacterium faecale]|uniref:Uncharacterized protein n=1 Tax=Sphingobacterium faecale TaxID=2803775 RepID=A0ABS1R1R7_9SPHI|nr:hypothetical protein [Sphingobacterium faecale]MBL1408204.1 hypothetical protein [Sphingobacterium faecale]
MIYISAQPDKIYFIWQLEILLRNLNKLGIHQNDIQVLVAYNKDLGLNPYFQKFIDSHLHLATFYAYEDQRERPKYTSSIRPNILKQHFYKYPELSSKTLMYHDSDILFSRIPHIDEVEENDICYVSDTRNYLDVNYIRNTSSENLLDDMLYIVGLGKDKLLKENQHTGGAQYILKGITADFWEKVENDAERLFVVMKDYNTKLWQESYSTTKEYKSKKRGIQAWCADMWAVLWNLWLHEKKVEIHPEMNFSWPYSPIEEWNEKSIQHYSGNIKEKEKHFKKTEYLNYMPWYDEALHSIPNTNCSYKIVKLIQARKKQLDNNRPFFLNSCVVFDGRGIGEEQLENFKLIKAYILKHLAIKLFLLTNDQSQTKENMRVNIQQLLSILDRDYEQVLWIPFRYTPDIKDIQDILESNISKDLSFYLKEIYKVDLLFTEVFSKVLDMELLHVNRGKFNSTIPLPQISIHLFCLPKDTEKQKIKLADIMNRIDSGDIGEIGALPIAYSFLS